MGPAGPQPQPPIARRPAREHFMQKVALVTGSGKRRVGWHVAETLAQRGYRLVVHYRTSAAEAAETVEHLRQFDPETTALQADLTDERQVARLVELALAKSGRIDVLVNAAASWRSKRLE